MRPEGLRRGYDGPLGEVTLSTGPIPRAPVTLFIITLYFESPATTSRLVKHIHLEAVYIEIKRLTEIIIEKNLILTLPI